MNEIAWCIKKIIAIITTIKSAQIGIKIIEFLFLKLRSYQHLICHVIKQSKGHITCKS